MISTQVGVCPGGYCRCVVNSSVGLRISSSQACVEMYSCVSKTTRVLSRLSNTFVGNIFSCSHDIFVIELIFHGTK